MTAYQISQPDDPREIDADTPQDVAYQAVAEYERLLREAIGYAERVEAAVRNGAMQDYLDVGFLKDATGASNPTAYADLSEEAGIVARANGALGVAHAQVEKLAELFTIPLLDRVDP